MDELCSKYISIKDSKQETFHVISKYIRIFVCITGIVCNLLATIVLTRKGLIRSPSNVILIVISISGILALVDSGTLFVIDINYIKYDYTYVQSYYIILPGCYFSCAVHTWMTVSLAYWRVKATRSADRGTHLTMKKVAINIIVVFILSMTFYAPYYGTYFADVTNCNRINFISNSTVNDTAKIWHINSRNQIIGLIDYFINTLLNQVIPTFTLLVLTIMLIKSFAESKRIRKNCLRMQRMDSLSYHAVRKSNLSNNSQVIDPAHSLILVFIFTLLCDLPTIMYTIYRILSKATSNQLFQGPYITDVTTICNISKLINCSSILFLLCINSETFRKEVKKIFCICTSDRKNDTN